MKCIHCPSHVPKLYSKSALVRHRQSMHPEVVRRSSSHASTSQSASLGGLTVSDVDGGVGGQADASVGEVPECQVSDSEVNVSDSVAGAGDADVMVDAYGARVFSDSDRHRDSNTGSGDERDWDGVSVVSSDVCVEEGFDRDLQEGVPVEGVAGGVWHGDVFHFKGETFSRATLLRILAGHTCDGLAGPLTASELRGNLSTPVCPGSRLSVYQCCTASLDMKERGGMSDNVFNQYCKLMHTKLLPEGNLFPPSLMLMERAIGCRQPHDVQQHMCSVCNAFYPPLPRSEWPSHKGDTCWKCEAEGRAVSKRFVVKNKLMSPAKYCFYWGVKDAVESYFQDADFMAAYARMDRKADTFYTSAEARRVFEAAGLDVQRDTDVIGLTLGLDGGQPFQRRVHNTWLLVLQCSDVPEQYRNQDRFIKEVAICPGSGHPDYFEELMTLISSEMGAGLVGMEVKTAGGGTRRVRWLLTGVSGDTPALRHATRHMGHSGTRGCTHCKGISVPGPKGSGRYWPPYLDHGVADGVVLPPHDATVQGDPAGLQLAAAEKVRDGKLRTGHSGTVVPHAMHVACGEYTDRVFERTTVDAHRKEAVRSVGAHGLSAFAKGQVARYFDYNHTVLVPLAHCGLHGVVSDLCDVTLSMLKKRGPKAVLKVVSRRSAHLTSTCDQGRHYLDIVNKRGYYTMEGWTNFLESYCLYIWDGLLVGNLAYLGKMWYLLRSGLLFFMRRDPVDDTGESLGAMCVHVNSTELQTSDTESTASDTLCQAQVPSPSLTHLNNSE